MLEITGTGALTPVHAVTLKILKFHICDFCVIINHKALDARFTLLPHLSYETYPSLNHFLLPMTTEDLTRRPPILIQYQPPYHRT